MVVSFFLTHLLLEVTSSIIFLPSSFRSHDLQEAKDSIDEEDSRPTSSTWSYIKKDKKSSLIEAVMNRGKITSAEDTFL